MTFPERLRQIRKDSGLTQKQLAKIAGTHQALISAYELGEREPGAFMLCCLADALHVTTDYLLGRSDRR